MASKIYQLDMFREEKDQQIEEFKKVAEKSIRGLFARYNEVCVMVDEIHRRLDRLTEEVYKNG